MMDKTKKYIEMCEKAEEIQKIKFNEWREKYPEVPPLLRIEKYLEQENSFFIIKQLPPIAYQAVWLPRQDQLQEMFGNFNRCYNELVGWGYDIAMGETTDEEIKYIEESFDSMEQLWLAFVMKEKYQKIWSEHDKNWITPKKRFILDEEYFKNQRD